MKIIISHPTANRNVRAITRKIFDAGMLHSFHTTLASFPGNTLDMIGNIKGLSEIKRRQFDKELRSYTKVWPWRELGRVLAGKARLTGLTARESGIFCVDAVYHSLDRRVAALVRRSAASELNAVYAYEDGALETFRQAKQYGLKCIYDLPIAYWETGRRLMLEEAERLPRWAPTLGGGIADSVRKLERKTKELELADMVVVASKFVKDSLPAWSAAKHSIVSPFGTPIFTDGFPSAKTPFNKRLRVLFAGSMGQRKGLADLFSAFKLLNQRDVELIVMGAPQVPMDFYRREYADFTYEPGRPNEQVLELMRTCDIFCLPSIVEGRALVMQEAMSQGLPLIITPNTGGEDLIVEGETGFLVPIRSPEVIAEKINWFLENRTAIAAMGEAARQHAEKISWDRYADRIIEALRVFLD